MTQFLIGPEELQRYNRTKGHACARIPSNMSKRQGYKCILSSYIFIRIIFFSSLEIIVPTFKFFMKT